MQKIFGLTQKGVKDLYKSGFTALLVYLVNMLPAILLMVFMQDKLLGVQKENSFYIVASLIIIAVMYAIYWVDYDASYNATYRESANLRIEIANILKKLPFSYFSKHNLSDMSQTVMSDVERIEHAMGHAFSKVLAFIIFFPIVAVLAISSNVYLGLTIVVPIVLAALFIVLSKRTQVYYTTKHYNILRENSEAFQEAIELQQEIKSYGLIEKVRKELYSKVEKSEKIHLHAEFMQGLPLLFSGWILNFMLGLVILVASHLLFNGSINVLYWLGYIVFSMKIKEGADGVFTNVAEIYYLDARIKRINEMRNTELQKGEDYTFDSYDVELKDVEFSYTIDSKVLDGVSFTAKQNEVTALVGASGCGKTTILRLISRLYDYDKGSIGIGGQDIKKVSTESLFSNISIVFQDVILFNNTVLENIRLGRKDATDEEVIAAAKLANCHDFIEKMENGYQTMLGENGARLSGGERQRISIARAFIKNAPIIILDEIAASLDVENESQIQDSLNHLIKGKTVLIISHRLKSIRNVHKIVVLNKGKVEAQGRHEDLLQTSVSYQSLVKNAKLAEEFVY